MVPLVLLLLKIALAIFLALKLFLVALAGVFCGTVLRRIKRALLARQRHKRFQARRRGEIGSARGAEPPVPLADVDAAWSQTPQPMPGWRGP